jgi:hypothetical protein
MSTFTFAVAMASRRVHVPPALMSSAVSLTVSVAAPAPGAKASTRTKTPVTMAAQIRALMMPPSVE